MTRTADPEARNYWLADPDEEALLRALIDSADAGLLEALLELLELHCRGSQATLLLLPKSSTIH